MEANIGIKQDNITKVDVVTKVLADEFVLHDTGISNYITSILENHEKMAWMLRAYLN